MIFTKVHHYDIYGRRAAKYKCDSIFVNLDEDNAPKMKNHVRISFPPFFNN